MMLNRIKSEGFIAVILQQTDLGNITFPIQFFLTWLEFGWDDLFYYGWLLLGAIHIYHLQCDLRA